MIGQPDDSAPIYLRLAEHIADEILAGTYPDGCLIPSTNRLAKTFNINPATAGHALTHLIQANVLERRRGIGTAVSAGARELLRQQRRVTFASRCIEPLLSEAWALGIPSAQIHRMLDTVYQVEGSAGATVE
jgi:GntR family transcriptional regulator